MPLLYEVARHVLVMSIMQSADVECLCKAHKLVQTTMQNRLKNNYSQTDLLLYQPALVEQI